MNTAPLPLLHYYYCTTPLNTTLASSPAPGRRISTGWPAAAAGQRPASSLRALAPALPRAAAAAAEAAAAVAQRRDHGRDVLVLKRAAPALVEQKPPEAKTAAPALLAALQWRGVPSLRAACGSGAASAAASPPDRSRSPSAAMGARGRVSTGQIDFTAWHAPG